VLVHVLDASNPDWPRQRRSVEMILQELGVDTKPTILAFNKIDVRIADAEPPLPPGAIGISAKTGEGLDTLRLRIVESLESAKARV
jgi:GTP-binding protein HflX